MPVYVDPIMNHGGSASFKWTHSCHMYADTLDELHAMASRIGMRRSWFQNKRVPHYDLIKTKRVAAIRAGAISHDQRQAVAFWQRMGWNTRTGPAATAQTQGELFK